MKEFESDAGKDLDAGWDEVEADVATGTVRLTSTRHAAEVEALDSGWEFDETPAPLAALATPALSKKARRELERKNRIHAARKQSEAKIQRKQQRREEQRPKLGSSPVETPAAAPPVFDARPARNQGQIVQRRGQKQPGRAVKPKTKLRPKLAVKVPKAKPVFALKPNDDRIVVEPKSLASPLLSAETVSAKKVRRTYWIVGIAVLVLLAIATLWAHLSQR